MKLVSDLTMCAVNSTGFYMHMGVNSNLFSLDRLTAY